MFCSAQCRNKAWGSTGPKPEIVLIPKLRPSLRPFAAIQRLFDLLQD
ncbi:hypothetical protein EMIT0P4_30387 [Pseudomonas sp. IT-P4]